MLRLYNRLRRMLGDDYRAEMSFGLLLGLLMASIAVAMMLSGRWGGQDLYTFYLPQAQGCLECGRNPWHASLILLPIRFIPFEALWPLWIVAAVLVLAWASLRHGSNLLLVLLTISGLGQLWLGQADWIVLAGISIAMLSKNPWARGAGLLLASIKPQVSAAVLLILMAYEVLEYREWRAFVLPLAAFLLTLFLWGIDWPLRWLMDLNTAIDKNPIPFWGTAARFPAGIVAFTLLPFLKSKRERVLGALYATALSMPWFGVYGYIVFLVMWMPWWALPLSWVWALAAPMNLYPAMQFAGLLPLGLLIGLAWPQARFAWAQIRTARPHQEQSF